MNMWDKEWNRSMMFFEFLGIGRLMRGYIKGEGNSDSINKVG